MKSLRKRQVIKAAVLKAPQNLKEAAVFVGQIGEAERKLETIKNGFNQEVERLKKEMMKQAKPYEEKSSQLVAGLQSFAESHREELTRTRKSVKLPTGVFGWHKGYDSVEAKDEEQAKKELKEAGLEQFIRIIEEIDRRAILKEPEAIEGLKRIYIQTGEEYFFVHPSELEIELITTSERLQTASA